MFTRRRIVLLIVGSFTVSLTLVVLGLHPRGGWQRIPQAVGLRKAGPSAEQIASGKNILPDLRKQRPRPAMHKQVYPAGIPKSFGSDYSRAVVITRKEEENVDWVDKELGDLLAPHGLFVKKIYVVDNQQAPLHPIENKGHEVMVYLSYIVDHYDALPDVSIFLHSHRFAWHNNEVVKLDAASMVRHLSPERVVREGYMNLRCSWDPGCPDWLHPRTKNRNLQKQEELLFPEYWSELFPGEELPEILAQPCCGQFALSRERIREHSLERYKDLQDWLLNSTLSDYLSGRLFEYTWQYLFTGNSVDCPAMHVCYCDGYGYCFGGANNFDKVFNMQYDINEYKNEVAMWKKNQQLIEDARDNGLVVDTADIDVPQVGRDEWLEKEIGRLTAESERHIAEAFSRGRSPSVRAEEAGRSLAEGDGF